MWKAKIVQTFLYICRCFSENLSDFFVYEKKYKNFLTDFFVYGLFFSHSFVRLFCISVEGKSRVILGLIYLKHGNLLKLFYFHSKSRIIFIIVSV